MHRSQRARGFTMIELLVVISIIALLIGLLLPVLGRVRGVTRRVACASNQRQIATALYAYIAENRQRVPLVLSPMHNNGFGSSAKSDAQVNPFDEDRWPQSLPNSLGGHMKQATQVFDCPAALVAWPREPGDWPDEVRMAYRPASANQPNGVMDTAGGYFREAFGFLDGRRFDPPRFGHTDDPLAKASQIAIQRGTYVRDLVARDPDGGVRGPHDDGINVLDREMNVEFRDHEITNQDLAPGGTGVKF